MSTPPLLPSASDMRPVMPFAVNFLALTLPAAIKTISRRGFGLALGLVLGATALNAIRC
jgi:hypothetical protein